MSRFGKACSKVFGRGLSAYIDTDGLEGIHARTEEAEGLTKPRAWRSTEADQSTLP